MLAYYDERAPDYDEAYTLGTGTASIRDPGVFTTEAQALSAVVERCVGGRVLDLACGTGYWLSAYASRCSHVTLLDQSERMLAECRTKVERSGLGDRCTLVRGDVFEHRLDAAAYDCALVGFLISHLTDSEEARLFAALKTVLTASGRFLILESAWSPARAEVHIKAGRQERRLNDGSAFDIYKRYFDRADVTKWARRYAVSLDVEHFGTAFLAVSGRF